MDLKRIISTRLEALCYKWYISTWVRDLFGFIIGVYLFDPMMLYLEGIYDILHRIKGKFLVLKVLCNPIKQLSYMLDFAIYIYTNFISVLLKKKKKRV